MPTKSEVIGLRYHGTAQGIDSPLGTIPRHADLTWDGMPYPEKRFAELMSEDPARLAEHVHSNDDFFNAMGDRFPAELKAEEQIILRKLG